MSGLDDMAARIAKRNAIRREISKVNRQISETRQVISGLNDCKRTIAGDIAAWRGSCGSFQASPINRDVTVTDRFEGNVAQTLSQKVPETAARMEGSCGEMEGLCGYIEQQISLLQEYIVKLQKKIQELLAALAAV